MVNILRYFCISCVLAFVCLHTANAQPISLCFTDNYITAELTLGFTDSVIASDLSVWTGVFGTTDLDVCFVDHPLPGSVDIILEKTPLLADATIYITDNLILADKTISITSNIAIADYIIGIWPNPTSFTKDIYIKDIEPNKLSIKYKIAILYCLGLIREKE